MTESPLTATAWPFIAGPAGAPRQAISLIWTGSDSAEPPGRLLIDGQTQDLAWTGHRAIALVPLAGATRTLTISGLTGQGQVEIFCTVEPPRQWELFLVPHSHVDIGYTEYQDILADAHGDYIAQALDLMTRSDGRRDPERYRWTCEASWTVEQFLRRHPGREEEFARRAREGRLEITALYVNMTDLFSADLIERSLAYATTLRDRYAVPLVTACNYDVNGFGWAVPSLLQRIGVKYLDTAINETRALGVRPRPTALRWASSDGASVLLWHSGNYLLGNRLLLHTSCLAAQPQVAEFLMRLQEEGYPHDAIEMLMSGATGDSMPPSPDVCDVVAEWNRTWLWPRLRLATTGDWFAHLEAHWPADMVTYQKAWPDWWADGNGSALYESALVRRTQARLADLQIQREVLQEQGITLDRLDEQYDQAWRRLMLFCEHTWGPYESAIAPDSPASRGQWYNKAGHAYAADGLATSIQLEQIVAAATAGRVSARDSGLTNATLQGVPSGYLASEGPAAVLVFNPLADGRDDVIRVHVPGHFCDGKPPLLRDAVTGQPVPAVVQRYGPHDVVNVRHFDIEFLARDLPARGHRAYTLEAGGEIATAPALEAAYSLENRHLRVELDPATGAIRSLQHRLSGRELVQQGGAYLLNQAIYERVTSPDDRNAVASWQGIGKRAVPFSRTTPTAQRIERDSAHPFARRLLVQASGPNGMALHTQIILYDHVARVDIVTTLHKPPTEQGEALYHAFPLATRRGQIYLDVVGGVMRPGLDQVPGTATDWHSIQNWFAVAESDFAVVVASPDVPLVQCMGINTGLWHETMPPSNGLVMSWALNNYWFTNFPVRQGGTVTYAYSIMGLEGPFDAVRAGHFAREIRHRAWACSVRLTSPEMIG